MPVFNRICDNCGAFINKPIAANGATVRTDYHGRWKTKHFCESCINGKYKELICQEKLFGVF